MLLVDSSAAAEDGVQEVFAKMYARFDTMVLDLPQSPNRRNSRHATRHGRVVTALARLQLETEQ